MRLHKVIRILIVINLLLLTFILVGRIIFFHRLAVAAVRVFLVPLFLSTLLYYILRPLNNVFIKKGIRNGRASLLTLSIGAFIMSGLLSYFGKYAFKQFQQVVNQLLYILNNESQLDGIMDWLNKFINIDEVYRWTVGAVKSYMDEIGHGFMRVAGYFINAFSTIFLIIVLVFYMLKDGHKLRERISNLVPERYKRITEKLVAESDDILKYYVTGQAKVALSLAILIFLGYTVIRMPNALLLSTITFILAFIPIVGFFISMIIPVVIALGMGLPMLIKLSTVLIIAQTLKGRVIVPAIMAKSMKIHPVTDIFLVIAAIGSGGAVAAFAIVPVYAILKNVYLVLKEFNKQKRSRRL